MPPRSTAVISAMGCISPMGSNAAATRQSLRDGRDGVREVDLFSTARFRCHRAGHVPEDFEGRAATICLKSRGWPRAAKLVLIAISEALDRRPDFQPDVVIAGTTSGGMDFGEQFFRGFESGLSAITARQLTRGYVPHQPVIDVLEHFGIAAPIRVISNACASGTNAIGVAANLVRRGQAERVLALGFDALAELVFAGFDALQASTSETCRPFDSGRSGLVLGEGAAAFCIERGDEVPDNLILAGVAGYGCANDNFHLTKPDPSGIGPRLSMERALTDAGWDAGSLDYLNAHGTGTPFNDASEAEAIRAVCPEVPFSSTKAMTGHALGAAGAIEAAFCLHAMGGEFLPPNIHLQSPMSGLNIVANESRPASVRRVISNSFGFGGSNASILFEKWHR